MQSKRVPMWIVREYIAAEEERRGVKGEQLGFLVGTVFATLRKVESHSLYEDDETLV